MLFPLLPQLFLLSIISPVPATPTLPLAVPLPLALLQEYAASKARDLGLGSPETPPSTAVDAVVLEGRAYAHLDAMRYRLNLLKTLVCVTSHAITPSQAEGLWLGLSFEALLGLGREAPQGLTTLAGTFFERMCCQDGGAAWSVGSGPWVEGESCRPRMISSR